MSLNLAPPAGRRVRVRSGGARVPALGATIGRWSRPGAGDQWSPSPVWPRPSPGPLTSSHHPRHPQFIYRIYRMLFFTTFGVFKKSSNPQQRMVNIVIHVTQIMNISACSAHQHCTGVTQFFTSIKIDYVYF